MASTEAANVGSSESGEAPVPKLRTFPTQMPLRYLDKTPDQPPDIPETVKRTWSENIVDSSFLQLNITPEQIRDLVYYGASELVKEPRELTEPSNFRTCVRWLLIYQRTWLGAKNDTDLKLLAISWNELLHHGPQTGDQRHWFLDHATNSYQQFYEAQRTDHNFSMARTLANIMIGNASTPRQIVQSHKRMGRLFGTHLDRFQTTHKNWRPIVNSCIHHLNIALAKLAEFPDMEPVASDKEIWEYCAWALDKRYDVAFGDADLLKVIEYYKVLIEKDKNNTKERLVWSDKLARTHWKRFTNLRIVKDGKDGIALFEKILETEPNNPHALSGLAELLRQTAGAEVLSNAERREITTRSIGLLEDCLAITPDGDTMLASRLGKLSEALVERYSYDADLEDIDMAIALQITAVGLPQTPTGALAFHHKQLAEKYVLKFQHTKDQQDIDEAITQIQKCIEMSSGFDGQDRENAKLGLARAYGAWYDAQNHLEHLELAISNGEEGLELCNQSGWRSIAALDDLAQLYRRRFERLNIYDDAAKGIKYIREAISMLRGIAGKNNIAHEAGCLSILSKLMCARAEVYNAEDDLNEAVRAVRDALNITDIEHQQYTPRAVDLSYNLTQRFRVLGNPADLKEADTVLDVAIQSLKTRKVPATDKERGLLENQYGIVCVCRWQSESDDKWVKEALRHFQAAVAAEPSSLSYSQNYASTITGLARDSGKLEDAVMALKAFHTYVQNIDKYAPETAETRLPVVVENLARLCLDKLKTDMNKEMFMQISIRLLEQLCQANKAQASVRLWAAGERSAIAGWREKNFEIASRFTTLAAFFLPEVLNPALSRVDQLRLTKSNSNLPSFNLAFHLLAGHTITQALQLFEQTRGVLWNRLIKESDELESLKGIDEELAKQFSELHQRLSAPRKPIASFESDKSMVFNLPDSYSDAIQYNALLEKIRGQPGLKDFMLLPSTLDELSSYTGDGAIVVVNCANNYSHAVIVTSSETAVIALPNYSDNVAKQLHEKMKSALESLKQQDEPSATKVFQEVCIDLWIAVAKPVLDKLDELLPENSIRQWKSKPVHRIWWLANQWINVLPIHAAGDYSSKDALEDAGTVLDRSISSYVSSFGALKFSRKNDIKRRAKPTTSDNNKVSAMIVSMPVTSGQADLPHAVQEASAVESNVARNNIVANHLATTSATRKAIVSGLKTSSIAHFICHGLVDITDPLKSQLLHIDSHKSPLDVRTLIRTNMPACSLIYLSVCSAAASETLPLVDEGLHIAGAFLMAGVPHVIGTRWELADQLAVTVAERFYARLVNSEMEKISGQDENHAAGIDVSRSAETLRDVLLTVRADGVPPILYSSYVHYGV